MINEVYLVYVLDDDDFCYDICGEFDTLEDAREYIKYSEAEDMKRLINDKYAIYFRSDIKIE